jgi:uncharacterized protein
MDFEWDEAKRLSNIEERGVDFRDAALISEGTGIAKEDTREDYGEQRFRALGRVDDEYYVVVAYTRRGSAVRIISAWKVAEDGKKRYEEILSRSTEGNARARRNRNAGRCSSTEAGRGFLAGGSRRDATRQIVSSPARRYRRAGVVQGARARPSKPHERGFAIVHGSAEAASATLTRIDPERYKQPRTARPF